MAKLKVSVNKNPTKEGIKVQFVFPTTLEKNDRASNTQKLQIKLSKSLAPYNLTVSKDNDVPYGNVIGFLIPIEDIQILITNALLGKQSTPEEPIEVPEEAPAPPAEESTPKK